MYQLSLTKDYAPHWDLVKAVKELLQNAIDSTAEFQYSFEQNDSDEGLTNLTVTSIGVTLPPSSLLLGASTKQEDPSSIGKYGEGYKLALLVLTRLGFPVTVYNGERVWTPCFEPSKKYGCDVLSIREQTRKGSPDNLTFSINGLSEVNVKQIRNACLQMQTGIEIGIFTAVPHGRILHNEAHKGHLYVNGLFVQKAEDLKFGYDIKPEYLKLDRDRQAVADFDLLWVTKEMWFAQPDAERTSELILQDVYDLKYAQYNVPVKVVEATAKAFKENNPGVTIAKTPEDVDRLKAVGVSEPRYFGGTVHAVVTQSALYKESAVVKVDTPHDILSKWYKTHSKRMPRLPKVAMKALLELSKSWK